MDVEKIVDQSHQRFALALDDAQRRAIARTEIRTREDGAGVADRPERVTQLVGEHGQEVVVTPCALLDRAMALALGQVFDDQRHRIDALDALRFDPDRKRRLIFARQRDLDDRTITVFKEGIDRLCPEHGMQSAAEKRIARPANHPGKALVRVQDLAV